MGWQLPPEHLEALKHPVRCFQDPDLKRAQILADPTGKPLARPGRLGEVYQARAGNDHQRWAVKCYRSDVPGLDRHYQTLSEHLLQADLPFLVSFRLLERGLGVRGHGYPVLKMGWAEGIPLNVFVAENADQPRILQKLARAWVRLAADLRRAKIAHGCLQHDHVLVSRTGSGVSLRLVDYDALYVPALEIPAPLEAGHPNFEHPRRLCLGLHDPEGDRFPLLVIYTALLAVAAGGRPLWERFDGGNNLLFKEGDFQEPAASAVFRELAHSPEPEVRTLAGRLAHAAQGSGRELPPLEVLADEVQTRPESKPEPSLRRAPNVEQTHRTGEIPFGADTMPGPVPAAPTPLPGRANHTFGILVEDGPLAPHRPADDNFDLIVDSDPNLHLPPVAKPPPLPATPPPLPQVSALPHIPGFVIDDPNLATYRLEAWMPEKVAVMKVQGFVDAATGEVVSSVPGFMQVRLLDPYGASGRSKSGILAWLGLAEQSAESPRILALLDFHMRHKETDYQKRLDITLEIRPGDAPPPPGKWRAYCDRLYCEVRAFLMGLQQ